MFGRRVLILTVIALGLATVPVRAVTQDDIDAAIAKGVKSLQAQQGRDGSWNYPQQGMSPGATALAGLTLVECGVKMDDDQVVGAANIVRNSAPIMTQTYTISLAIMFLDRLGEAGDVPLIESLTVRLLAGQTGAGGWGYDCPSISDDEVARLQTTIKNRTEIKGGRDLPGKRTTKDLPKEIQGQLQSIQRAVPVGGMPGGMAPPGGKLLIADNSNTQFASLALWIGRRHGLPVENALARIDNRFRRGQNRDGTWGYLSSGGGGGLPPDMLAAGSAPSSSMTCSAIIGLTVAHGLAHDTDAKKGKAPFDPSKDMVLAKGLLALGTGIGNPGGQSPKISKENFNGKAYYFLWSLERVCMALNLQTIGNKDWYKWGAEVLLANQLEDGSWQGEYGEGGADTCFALLFLRRSNLVKDISTSLKGRLKDPAIETTLKSGGIGSLSNAGKDLKSALDKQDKTPDDPRSKDKPKLKPIESGNDNSPEGKHAKKLVEANDGEFKGVLDELREAKGREYTYGLARAIPSLKGEPREQARKALGARLIRLTPDSLAVYYTDADVEVRRAAAIASGSKGLLAHVPLLIERLNDGEPTVVNAAAKMLAHLSKKDFGPEAGATREEHDKAIKDWKAWWKEQGEK